MKSQLTRRDFLGTTAAAATALAAAAPTAAAPFETKLKKALIGKPIPETLASWKAAGFAEIETRQWNVTPEQAAKGREVADSLGMKIHAVMRGWANFNDPATVEKDREEQASRSDHCREIGAAQYLLASRGAGPLKCEL